MKNFILSYSLFESSNSVIGLPEFISTLNEAYPGNDDLFKELSDYIINSGCPAIKFEAIYGAQGISKTDECIINKSVLKSNISNVLYVILHEISHQYQYSKYGKNVMWDAYNSNIDIDTAVDLLINIELVADKLAFLKTNNMIRNHNVKNTDKVTPFYNKMDKSYYKKHLERLRDEVSKKGMTSVDQINDYMYNKLKIKPVQAPASRIGYNYTNTASRGVPRNTPKKNTFNNQSEIDKILDKLSKGSWSDLSEKEKNILRSASKK